ncbi:MmyB family transcriptional regulator [Thorsellia kenyensis]|uniref:Helix-turn-helix domain-containing protein n=1 Tax=Thorsellia kenyensis TaxID=1549888 RepID=A0ABV6CA38_9GAMM
MTLSNENSKNALGNFLRKLRESASADMYGFKTISVRRTPGLRREELAQLCDVSTTWITLLEQGRASPPSLKLIQRIISQLKLNKTQSDYFLELYIDAYSPSETKSKPDDFLEISSEIEKNEIYKILSMLVYSFSSPAYVIDPKWDMICWNQQIAILFKGWLDNADFFTSNKNLLNFIFINDSSRDNLPDWEYRARRSVAEFRNDSAPFKHIASVNYHIEFLLKNSLHFKTLWEQQEVLHRDGVIKSFRQEDGKLASYRQISCKIEAFPALRLILLLPES